VSPQSQQPEFVYWFRQSSPYIRAFRNRAFVIAIDGAALVGPKFINLAQDITLLSSLGIRIILVHGARPQIEQRMQAQGVTLRYVNGVRVTDDSALSCVKDAVGNLRIDIEAIFSRGMSNAPTPTARTYINSANVITAKPLGVRNGVDYCHTGEIRKVDSEAINRHLDAGELVLLSPLGYSSTGEVFNLTANEVAMETAIAVGADKLIFLTETEQMPSLPPELKEITAEQASALLPSLNLEQTEPHYLACAIEACTHGVQRTHLIDRTLDGGILQELFTREGLGILVSAQRYENIRQANIEDVGGILALIRPLEQSGVLMRRSREQLELEINHFTVVVRDGTIVACAAIYPFDDEKIAELACMAVHEEYQGEGRGDQLLKTLTQQAKADDLQQLFVLTTQTAHWFQERGFVSADLAMLPQSKQKLYNYQRNSKVFVKQI